MTAVGATVLCNGDNSSVCSVPLTLNGGGQDYGTISFNFWPNQGSREFNLTFTLATTYSGTITEDFATLFAEVNGYAPLSVTYNLTSPYTYTLVK